MAVHIRQVFVILFFSLFIAMLGAGVISPTMPLYAETLGATGWGLGVIYSSFSVSRAVFMPVVGKLSDRRGRKIFIVLGLTIYTLASLGYIWADSIVQLVWIRFLHGVGSAMIVPVAAAAIGDISPRGREGRLMGTFNVALFLGFGAGPLLGGLVMDALSMSWVFVLMGALSFVSLISILVFLPERQRRGRMKTRNVSRLHTLWREPVFRGLVTFRFSNAVARGSVTAFIPVFASRLDIDAGYIGLLVSLNILLTGGVQHFFGPVADRLDRRKLVVFGNLVGIIPLLLTPFAGNLGHLLVLGVVMGVGSGLAFPAASAIATELGREHGMGNIMGFFNQSMSLGMITGPVVAGCIMDLFNISVVFIFGGIVGLMGSLLAAVWFGILRGTISSANV
jgi:MFS family permease